MHKIRILVTAIAASLVSVASVAQENKGEEAVEQPIVPVEIFTCNWRKGKDEGDLAKLNARLKTMMDKDNAPYSAWTLTPQFRAGEDGFDIAWLGSWTSGAAMGGMVDSRGSGEAAELFSNYNEVVDCSGGHMLMSAVTVHAPDGPPDDGLVMFSSCTVDEDSNMDAAMKAHAKASADIRARGPKGASWLFHPALGFGETDFDYYMVVAMPNYAELGKTFDIFMNGGGWAARQKIYDGVVSCDSPRVYDAKLVRKPASS